MGQSRKDLLNIIAALIPYIGYPKALNALNLLDDIKSRMQAINIYCKLSLEVICKLVFIKNLQSF